MKLLSSTSRPTFYKLQHNSEELLSHDTQNELEVEVRFRKIIKLFLSNNIDPLDKMLNGVWCASLSNGKIIPSNVWTSIVDEE